MRNDSRTGITTGRARRTPSFKALAWTALAGTLLLANAQREDDPPPPVPRARESVASPASGGAPDGRAPDGRAPDGRAPDGRAPDGRAPARSGAEPMPASDPVRIRIPAIKVDAFLMRLELDAEGALQPPPATAPALAGWYADGTRPGSRGTAVLAGHLDTPAGPAVFHQLGALTRGAEIAVDRQDGRTALFTVDAVEEHQKGRFPSAKVYGDSGRPELRLITCGGGWSSSTGYQANTVVYATLTAAR
ncbi:class F sortase [Streptomyces sp. Je 1-79]|uniref:class F sortase n=1 Tax=Streptomyces sp. Je 1-79 TaxID=2943847 RepID=UPI0021A38BB3|nr:class F sortase [Streptomyces sp. Je 1-79]MCT4351719.1 class F sortase [Streptomyces sp. Je 1-79]